MAILYKPIYICKHLNLIGFCKSTTFLLTIEYCIAFILPVCLVFPNRVTVFPTVQRWVTSIGAHIPRHPGPGSSKLEPAYNIEFGNCVSGEKLLLDPDNL